MFAKRRFTTLIAALTVGVTALVASPTPAHASDTVVNVAAVHAGGAGATAARATATLTWLNRSVRIDNVKLYCAGHHKCQLFIFGDQGNTTVDFTEFGEVISYGSTPITFDYGDKMLDGSAVRGGITEVRVYVHDNTHSPLYGLQTLYR